jgi:hypothetical protein
VVRLSSKGILFRKALTTKIGHQRQSEVPGENEVPACTETVATQVLELIMKRSEHIYNCTC